MPAPWPVADNELAAAHCDFKVDHVPKRPDITQFKRRSRWQQAWWRERYSLPIGGHTSPGKEAPTPNGSRMELTLAKKTGCNFLSQEIRDTVAKRLSYREPHQTLNEERLWSDLLSSMPMCFNLFGELDCDRDRFNMTVAALWPDSPGDPYRLLFEWSPGRRNPRYLNNRSAFDCAILLRDHSGKRGVIGIETKYHEHTKMEATPDADKRLPRYIEVTKRSKAFRTGWESTLIGTDLQQFWLDHLLVLSMLQHPDTNWSWGRFVVAYPTANKSIEEAADRYKAVLVKPDTFEALAIEQLLAADVLHDAETAKLFRERYLW